jgi:hypothetical protein
MLVNVFFSTGLEKRPQSEFVKWDSSVMCIGFFFLVWWCLRRKILVLKTCIRIGNFWLCVCFWRQSGCGKKIQTKTALQKAFYVHTHIDTKGRWQMMNGELRSMPGGTTRWVPSVVDISLVLLVHLVALHGQALLRSGEAIWLTQKGRTQVVDALTAWSWTSGGRTAWRQSEWCRWKSSGSLKLATCENLELAVTLTHTMMTSREILMRIKFDFWSRSSMSCSLRCWIPASGDAAVMFLDDYDGLEPEIRWNFAFKFFQSERRTNTSLLSENRNATQWLKWNWMELDPPHLWFSDFWYSKVE